MKFILRAKRTRFVLLYVFGVDGSIWRPGPAPCVEEPPFAMRELMPLRLLIDEILFVGFGETDWANIFCFSVVLDGCFYEAKSLTVLCSGSDELIELV